MTIPLWPIYDWAKPKQFMNFDCCSKVIRCKPASSYMSFYVIIYASEQLVW